jgi:exopolysaccharide biosynthesis WecB/TagA/CpsF family protein
MNSITIHSILGAPIHAVTMEQALDLVHEAIVTHRPLQVGVVNAAKLVNMQRDARLRSSVLASDIILADGMSVVWASRVLGSPLPERVTGIDLMMRILERGNRAGYRVYLLGAKQEVVEEVARRIAADYPGVQVAGFRNGYFGADDEAQIADAIAAAHADVLFVAMTSPKKEEFMARWETRLGVKVSHGVGGSFDVYTGVVSRAPASWQTLGLEWLYRVLQEPGRLWMRYLITNTLFIVLVARELLRTRRGTARSV